MKPAKPWMQLLVFLALAIGWTSGVRADEEMVDDVTWNYTVSGETATVNGASPVEGSLTIPSKLGEFPVTRIGSYAFDDSFDLTSVTIPDSVTCIDAYAFLNCTGLKEVTVLGNVTNDWGNARYNDDVPFGGCAILETVVFGEKVTKIGSYMFSGCPNLASVTMPEGVMNIGRNAFGGTSLTDVVIPNSVTNIGDEAFYFSSLTDVTIPASVTKIGSYAFSGTSLTDVDIPDSVRSIGYRSFYDCSNLTSVVIGYGVTSIGNEALLHCNLESIEVSTNNPAYASKDGVLFDKTMSTLIQYPTRKEGAYVIPDGVTNIGSSAFAACTNLTNVTIPDSVTNIGNDAFHDCQNLVSVSIGSGVKNIGTDAFLMRTWDPWQDSTLYEDYFAPCLSEVHIHDLAAWCRISFANKYATPCWYARSLFLNGEGLRDLRIPSGITKLGPYAFYGIGLTNVIIPDEVTSIGSHAFYDCSLRCVTMGGGVIGTGAFAWNTYLKNVTIGTNATQIGQEAFAHCTALTNMTMGDNVTQIGQEAFDYCKSLTRVTIPTNVTYIGGGAFDLCEGLVEVIIPNGVTSIPSNLFAGCYSLAKVTIGSGVKSIGSEAFSSCKSLISLIFPANVTSIGKNALSGCTGLVELYVPENWKGTTKLSGSGVPSECTVIYGAPLAEVVDGVTWHYTVGKENATIVSGNYKGELAIPETLGGYPVTSVGAVAFAGCKGLEQLVISESVLNIGRSAFAGCSGLLSVEIPDSVTNIGTEAFFQCTELTNVSIGRGVLSLGTNAFSQCTGLTTVAIDSGLEKIGPNVFSECTALSRVVLGDEMTFLGSYMFSGCGGLREITIPEKVTHIGAYAFYGTGLTDMTIPTGVTNMGYGAFAFCRALTNVTVLGNITNDWYDNSYYTWEQWDEWDWEMHSVPHASDPSPFSGCTNLRSVVFGDNVRHIGTHMFEGCGLTNVTIPESVYSMGYGAFAYCTALKNVTILGQITNDWGQTWHETMGGNLDDFPFLECTNLQKVVLGEKLQRIGAWMFGSCSHLSTLTIPDSIRAVGSSAFCGSGLKTLYVPVSWEGTSMLANAEVPADCKVVYGTPPADETTTSGVPHSWLDMNAADLLTANGGDYEAAAKAKAANGVNTMWECYVAGLDPKSADQRFAAGLSFMDGKPMVSYAPAGQDGRVYTVYGKKSLADATEDWTDVADTPEPDAYRFFRVGVSLE